MKSKKKTKDSNVKFTFGENCPKYVIDWHKKHFPDAMKEFTIGEKVFCDEPDYNTKASARRNIEK